jgi:hypothetical protein
MGHSRTGARAVKRADDVAKALDLRREGQSLRDISAAINRSVAWVHKELERYTREHPAANLEELRLEADANLRLLLKQVMPIATGRKAKLESKLWAIDRALKIRKQLTDLHGLDAPTKTVFDVSGLSDGQLRAIVSGSGEEPEGGGGGGTPATSAEGGASGEGSEAVGGDADETGS